ncbi:hypothetical protein B1A_00558, partial [mine drainage metagenome]
EPAPRREHREALRRPRHAVPRPDPGGQPRPDQGRREVRLPQGLQVLDLCDLVDPAGDHPRDRGSGENHPHPGAHGRDDQQAHPRTAPPAAGTWARTDRRRDRRGDGRVRRTRAGDPQGRAGAGVARDADRRGGRLAPSATSSRTRTRRRRPRPR